MSAKIRAAFRCTRNGNSGKRTAAYDDGQSRRMSNPAAPPLPLAQNSDSKILPAALLAALIVLAGSVAMSVAGAQEKKQAAKPAAKEQPETPAAKKTAPQKAAPEKPAPKAKAEAAAPAAPQQAQPAARPQQSFIQWLITASGFFFFPQLFISIALIALIVTNLLAVRRRNFIALEFVSQFETLVKERKFNEAFELARQEVSMVGRLIAAGLQRLTAGYSEAVRAMQETGEEENMKYEHRLSYLALIGNVATLVGLLGTVWGMVSAFMVIGQSDVAPKPSELARGVSQALVTTVMGLIQAIPAIIFFTILRNRTAALILEVGIVGERLMQNFKGVVARRPAEAASSTSVGSKSSTARPASQSGGARPSSGEHGFGAGRKRPEEPG